MDLVHADPRPSVLVVDDDPRSLKLMTIMLDRAGYRAVTASGALQGLECLAEEHPDAIIADLVMPGVDGLEFCRQVRELQGFATTPLVLSTAMASSDVRQEARSAGVDVVLLKPFERSELLEQLAGLLERARIAPADGRGDEPPGGR